MRTRLTMLGAGLLAGCSLEPHYMRPDPLVPPSWPAGDAGLRTDEATLPAFSYRDVFRDPKLQAIIARALADNQDLAAALANVASARALYRVQRAGLLPRIDASVRATTSDAAGRRADAGTTAGVTDGGGTTTSYVAEAGTTAFELDLFGRLRSLSHAAFQQYLGTEAAARAVRLTLVGDVADAYLTLATDRSLLAIAIDTEKSAARSVDLARARLVGGVAPRADLRQAETVLYQARADHADLATSVAQDRNALELLVGSGIDDAELPVLIESVDGLIVELPAGLDSRVLLRRPDVVQAEHALRAADARIGAARAAFFPTISLTAIAGFASTALSSLFSGGAFTWSAAPSASLPIFDGGANRGNLAYAKAQRVLAIAQYQHAVQAAFRDVADALARRRTIAVRIAAQLDLEAAARDTYALQNARYREGIDPYLNTLDAQRTLYSARRASASARLARADNLVALYRALGGDQLLAPPPPR